MDIDFDMPSPLRQINHLVTHKDTGDVSTGGHAMRFRVQRMYFPEEPHGHRVHYRVDISGETIPDDMKPITAAIRRAFKKRIYGGEE